MSRTLTAPLCRILVIVGGDCVHKDSSSTFFIEASEKWGIPLLPGTELDSVLQGEVYIYMAMVYSEDSAPSPNLGLQKKPYPSMESVTSW